MLGIRENSVEHSKFLKLLEENSVETFQPPYSKITTGPTRRPDRYLKSNRWLDKYIKDNNLVARLSDRIPVNPSYKNYEENVIRLF